MKTCRFRFLIRRSKTYKLVLKYFDFDFNKTNLWFSTENPNLGDISPNEMVLTGGYKNLKFFVINALEGTNQ